MWSTGGALGVQVIQFFIFLVLANRLTPDDYGLIGIAVLFISLLQVVVEGGFTQAIVQRKELTDEHLSTGFWINMGLGVAAAGMLALCAPLIAEFYEAPELTPVMRVLALNLILTPLSGIPTALLRRELHFKVLTVRSIIATAVAGVVGIGMALSGFGVWALVANSLAGSLVSAVILWRSTSFRPRRTVTRSAFGHLWGFGINVQGSNLVNFANNRAADFAISSLLGKTAMGFYTVASRISTLVTTLVVQSTSNVAFSTFAKLQAEPERFARAYYASVGVTALIAMPVFVGLSVLAPEIVAALLGDKWAESAPLMRIVSLMGIVTCIGSYNVAAVGSLGKPAWNFRLDLLNALVTIGLIVLVWRLDGGIEWIVGAFVVRAYALWPLRYALLTKISPLSFGGLGRAVAGPLAATAAMAGALLLARRFTPDGFLTDTLPGRAGPVALLTVLTALGGAVYAAAVWTLAPGLVKQVRSMLTGAGVRFSARPIA